MLVHRLTVNGRDYFLPDPVTELRSEILAAVRAGGGYVHIPPVNSGPGIDLLFSPGMPVSWVELSVDGNDGSGDDRRADNAEIVTRVLDEL